MIETHRINLGAGDNPIDGYDNSWDAKQGRQAYPLKDLADESVDELRVSHLLEHFGHRGAAIIVKEWARVLKPGGLMKIAVPDFEKIAEMFVRGEPGQYQGWISGGQVDPLDSHLAQYTWNSLSDLLRHCGLVGIHKWPGDKQDCSGLPISLNVAGYKRPAEWPRVIGVMSHPRFGIIENLGCVLDSLPQFNIPLYRRTGAFWGQCMTSAIEAAIEDGAEWVLAMDYDTVFTEAEILDLMMFAVANTEADALVPVKVHRMLDHIIFRPAIFRPAGAESGRYALHPSQWDVTYWPISMGHFGCTLIKTEAILRMRAPWFWSTPDDDNSWSGKHTDDDRWFWDRFVEAGNQAFLCPRVVLGHFGEVVQWPDRNLHKIYQPSQEWQGGGKPRNCWR